jgi:hypothetical protein
VLDPCTRLIRARGGRCIGCALQVYVDEPCGLSWQLARLLKRLDAYGRLQLHALTELPPEAQAGGSWIVSANAGEIMRERAFGASVRALPCGWLLRWAARPTA